MNSEPDVAIAGGGAAGVGAARALAGRGLSIVLLEAMERLGGRACTKKTAVGPLDLGCGWLHSADRNPWTTIAAASGFQVIEGPTAWGQQYRGLGFSLEERADAQEAASAFRQELQKRPPASDRASDALPSNGKWNAYLQAISGFGNGDELERISARDYMAYETASTEFNWRVAAGYGALVSASIPVDVEVSLKTPLKRIEIGGDRLKLTTDRGTLRPKIVIMTVSTNIIAGDAIRWPKEFGAWREAASQLPLGNNEKLFLEIVGNGSLSRRPMFLVTHVSPRLAATISDRWASPSSNASSAEPGHGPLLPEVLKKRSGGQ